MNIDLQTAMEWGKIQGVAELAFAGSKFANRLKPLLAMGLHRAAIFVVLLRILALFGRFYDPRRGTYLQ